MLTLSPDQIMSFRDEGLLVVDELIDQATVICLRERFDQLFEGEFETGVQPDEVNWPLDWLTPDNQISGRIPAEGRPPSSRIAHCLSRHCQPRNPTLQASA